jgi:hypothetical protein
MARPGDRFFLGLAHSYEHTYLITKNNPVYHESWRTAQRESGVDLPFFSAPYNVGQGKEMRVLISVVVIIAKTAAVRSWGAQRGGTDARGLRASERPCTS